MMETVVLAWVSFVNSLFPPWLGLVNSMGMIMGLVVTMIMFLVVWGNHTPHDIPGSFGARLREDHEKVKDILCAIGFSLLLLGSVWTLILGFVLLLTNAGIELWKTRNR